MMAKQTRSTAGRARIASKARGRRKPKVPTKPRGKGDTTTRAASAKKATKRPAATTARRAKPTTDPRAAGERTLTRAADTERFAERLARALTPGTVVALVG